MKRIVILGAGTGGTMMANRLHRTLASQGWTVTVVDRDGDHVYQPGLLFVPFGDYRPDELVRPRRHTVDPGVDLRLTGVTVVNPERKQVHLGDGSALDYELLVVATGSRIVPEEVQGLTDAGWQRSAFDFYTLDGATRLAAALERFEGGRLVVHVGDMPIKCPVAPLEFAFLADAFLTQRGLRERTELVFTTPLDGAFTRPRASAVLGEMMARRNIRVEADLLVEEVSGHDTGGQLKAYDGRTLDYDLLVTTPPHRGAQVVATSGLGDEGDWLPTDPHTLQTRAHSDIFALGDCTDLPASKAGSVAHFQSEVLTTNLLRHIAGLPPLPEFDGHSNCFVETGFGKAMLIDFNYETEPLPGRFPLPGVGPFALLEESRLNHWGKLGFRWVYWNMLLPGDELPLDHRMVLAGKRR